MHIFLDLDGVLVNTHKILIERVGRSYEETLAKWPVGKYEIATVMGFDYKFFWDMIREEGTAFWADAPAYPWAKDLYALCCATAPTWFLTNPIGSPGCMFGKFEWLRKFTGNEEMRNYMMGKHKYLCSKPGALLIDDFETNCDEFNSQEDFEGRGGEAILFPGIWNRNHQYAADPMAYVTKEIRKWKELQATS